MSYAFLGAKAMRLGCNGKASTVPFINDVCGKCGGDNSSCIDCAGTQGGCKCYVTTTTSSVSPLIPSVALQHV